MANKHYLTDRANERLKQLFRAAPQPPVDTNTRYGVPSLPLLARATEDVAAFRESSFSLRKKKPTDAGFADSGATRSAIALCEISSGAIVRLDWMAGEQSGGFWAASPCGETEAPLDGTQCPNVSGGVLGLSVPVTISGVTHNETAFAPANWISSNEAVINQSFTLTGSAERGREIIFGNTEEKRTIVPAGGCQRVYYGYHDLPDHQPTGSTTPDRQTATYWTINCVRVYLEFNSLPSTNTLKPYSCDLRISLAWGFKSGDPLNGGYFEDPTSLGAFSVSESLQQAVTFLHEDASPISGVIDIEDPTPSPLNDINTFGPNQPGNNDTSYAHFDFNVGEAQITVNAATQKTYVVNLQSELPSASSYQSGETVVVCNDGANTGVYVATGAKGGAASSWTKS